jgi:SAM-dependent methyltransferase
MPHHRAMRDALHPSPDDAFAAWSARVRANAEQVERMREAADPADFYGPTATFFRADPRRRDEPLLDDLLALARRDETWLDIGAGAGRYALPLALAVSEVVAVEPSPGMAAALREGMVEGGIANVRVVEGGWPPAEPTTGVPIADPPHADVAMIAHLGYDIERLEPFLRAMERAARRLCVAVLMERAPASVADPFWPIVHGEERIPLPALGEFVAVLGALGRPFEVRLHERAPRTYESADEAIESIRRQLWIAEGGAKGAVFVAAARERLVELDGRWTLRDQPIGLVGLVSWTPG